MGCTEICMDNKTWKAIYKRPPLLLGSIEMVLVHMKYNGFLEIICVCVYIYIKPFFCLSLTLTPTNTRGMHLDHWSSCFIFPLLMDYNCLWNQNRLCRRCMDGGSDR